MDRKQDIIVGNASKFYCAFTAVGGPGQRHFSFKFSGGHTVSISQGLLTEALGDLKRFGRTNSQEYRSYARALDLCQG